jgi:hypothetical protein
VSTLITPVFVASAWAQPATVVEGKAGEDASQATVVAGTTAEGAALACVPMFDVGSDSQCGGWDDC